MSQLTSGDPRLPPLIFLHGFLGSKEDWIDMFPFFNRRFHCIATDLLYDPIPIPENAIVIGYSMGGRIALQLQEKFRAVVAISAHPGLKTQEERDFRAKTDAAWCEKLRTLPFSQFLSEWYAQPIFKKAFPRKEQDPHLLARMLEQMSLAKQPHIEQFPRPTLFIYGEEDLKYRELYCKLPNTVTVRGVPHCGHAVHLENPAACAEHINEVICKTHLKQ